MYKKEFDRIFSKKTTTLNKEEEKFFENTEFKVLIIGGDSNLAVQTFKGYSHFLNLIYNSKFTETSYGVPITCSFSYANSHGLVETEFINTIHIEPLYVKPSRENNSYLPDYSNKSDYHSSSQLYLYFYKDREKTKPSQPYIDIIFNISMFENKCNYEPNYKNWPMINANCTDKTERIIMRNIDFKSKYMLAIIHHITKVQVPCLWNLTNLCECGMQLNTLVNIRCSTAHSIK